MTFHAEEYSRIIISVLTKYCSACIEQYQGLLPYLSGYSACARFSGAATSSGFAYRP
jgi:hypothetical protein